MHRQGAIFLRLRDLWMTVAPAIIVRLRRPPINPYPRDNIRPTCLWHLPASWCPYSTSKRFPTRDVTPLTSNFSDASPFTRSLQDFSDLVQPFDRGLLTRPCGLCASSLAVFSSNFIFRSCAYRCPAFPPFVQHHPGILQHSLASPTSQITKDSGPLRTLFKIDWIASSCSIPFTVRSRPRESRIGTVSPLPAFGSHMQ
jgi:hypothetical protein